MVVYIINPVAMETDTANWIASLVYFVSARPEVTGVWDKKNKAGLWPPHSHTTDMHMSLHIQACLYTGGHSCMHTYRQTQKLFP